MLRSPPGAAHRSTRSLTDSSWVHAVSASCRRRRWPSSASNRRAIWSPRWGRRCQPPREMATDEPPNRKQDEDAGVPDEATLRSLIDQLPLTVYIDHLDGKHTNVFTSPQLEKELGYSIDEWRADPDLFARVLHPHDRERVLDAGNELVQSGEGARLEYRMIARDGRVRWYLDQSAVVPATARTAGLAHGFLLDITEQKA